jgi:hypothetical protein
MRADVVTDGAIHFQTSQGRLTAEFATNGWVLLTCGERSGQSRAFKQRQLAATLRTAYSLGADEADEAAAAIWRQRPRDASMRSVTSSMFVATGLPAWTVVPLVFAVILAIAIGFAIALRLLQ